MNKTEAIKVLKKELQIIDDPNFTMTAREWEEHDDHMRDALDMAIEALSENKRTDKRTETHACDCISRQAVLNLAKEGKLLSGNIYKKASDYINELPSADRPTGHWIENDNGTFSCSNCQSWIPEEQHHYARHCLYCGARMESLE